MAPSVAPPAVAPSGERRLAVIDLGSNTFRLVVFRHSPGGSFQLVDEIRQPSGCRPAPGTASCAPTRWAAPPTPPASISSFCAAGGVDEIAAVATSALRDAANRERGARALIGRGRAPGVRVLSAEEEALVRVLGVLNTPPCATGYVLDLGGGSVQLSLVRAGASTARPASRSARCA